MLNRWEVWLAKVKFEDDPSKVVNRPVLVLDNGQCCILSIKITKTPPRSNFEGEYRIVKWREAKLKCASTLRCSKRLRLIPADFIHRIGRLHPIDIKAVQEILNMLAR